MKPYYDDGSITIYHGDCRDVIYDIEADVVLTDPPYGIEGGTKRGLGGQRGKGSYEPSFIDDGGNIEDVVLPTLNALLELVGIGCVVLTPGNRHLHLYPRAQSFGVLYQPASSSIQTFGNLDAQPILYYGTNASLWGDYASGRRQLGIPCSYQVTERSEDIGHPCPKPLGVWTKLLGNISSQDQVILDPFMGSGTTLRAAKDLGRKAIGIELEEKYCEIAAERLGQEVLDLEAAAPQLATPTQPDPNSSLVEEDNTNV